SRRAISVSATNPAFSSRDGVMFDKFQNTLFHFPQGLSGSYQIPTSVTTIGTNAFEECQQLSSIGIPNSVLNIEQGAFGLCFSLTNITIPASVTNIGHIPFLICTNLIRIDVDANNPNYSSLDGVLFDNAQTTLIECPA